jgi:predicted DNA-binding transcriptional regulator AlpA
MVRLIDKKQFCEKLGIGRSKFDALYRAGLLPKQQNIPGCSKNLWLESVADEWILENLHDAPTEVAE